MRILMWYCDSMKWTPAMKTLEDAPDGEPGGVEGAVAAFVHVEPGDTGPQETKLVKNVKWLARKWETDRVVLHSFTHLGEAKAEPAEALALLERAGERIASAGLTVTTTPYGHFLDLKIDAPGHPLARVYKEFPPQGSE